MGGARLSSQMVRGRDDLGRHRPGRGERRRRNSLSPALAEHRPVRQIRHRAIDELRRSESPGHKEDGWLVRGIRAAAQSGDCGRGDRPRHDGTRRRGRRTGGARRCEAILRQESGASATAGRHAGSRAAECEPPAGCDRRRPASVKDRPHVQDFDWSLLAIVAAICGLGVMEIYSSTHASAMAGMQWRQLTWLGIGVAGMFLISRIDYHTLLDQAPVLYICGVAGLLVVMVIGSTHLGAKRWISMGGIFNLQVSEIMKLIIIIVLARFFSEVRTDRLTLADLLKVGALTIVPAALILKQPDLGTAMVLVPVAIVGAFIAGIEWRHMAIGVILVALLIPVGWNMRHHLKPYQQQRIETFLHPEEDQRGAGYQILQSEIAVGSGGFWGKGFGKGSQNQLGFVPVRYSDFILAALAEEQGFIGVCIVLLLYLGLILRLVDNAQKAKDRAGMYVVAGVTAILGFHVLVNASMVIGYMPVTGIPLPLMSYGGSSTAFVFLALGLVMNVRMRRFVN